MDEQEEKQRAKLTDVSHDWRQERNGPNAKQRTRIRRFKIALVTSILGCIVAFLVWMFARNIGGLPPVQFVGFGITNYEQLQPHPCGQADVELLTELFNNWHQISPDRVREVESTSVSKDDNLLAEIKKRLKQSADLGDRVILYISAHGLVQGQGGLGLLPIRANPENISGGLVTIRALFSAIAESGVKDLILCLDVGGLTPDPTTGIIAHEESRLITQEIEAAVNSEAFPKDRINLCVICSHDVDQVNWPKRSDSNPNVPSIFAEVIRDAIEGKADGWNNADAADGRISTEELWSYVKNHVREWSGNQRGIKQNVVVLTNSAADQVHWFAVRRDQYAQAIEAMALEDEANAKAAEKSEGSVGDDGASRVGESPQQAQTTGSEEDEEALTLADAWQEWETLKGDYLAYFPNQCRKIDSILTAAETAHSFGLNESVRGHLDLYLEAIQVIKTWNFGFDEKSLARFSCAFSEATTQELSEDQLEEFSKIYNLFSQDSADNANFELPLPESMSSQATQLQFAHWLLKSTSENFTPRRIEEVKRLLTKLAGSEFPQHAWPYELHALNGVVNRLAVDGSEVQAPTEAWLSYLRMQVEFSELYPTYRKLTGIEHRNEVLTHLSKSVRAMTAAERWLMNSNEDDDALRELDTVRTELQAFRDHCDHLDRAHRLLNEILVDFTSQATWLGWLRESVSTSNELFLLLANTTFSANTETELRELYNKWPTGDHERERMALRVCLLTRELRRQLSTTPLVQSDLRNTVDELEDEYKNFRKRLIRRLESLTRSERAISAMDWVLLERTCTLPWIPWDQRSLIRKALRTKTERKSISPKDSVFNDNQGLWVAFWGLQALALNDIDSIEVPWGPWNNLANAWVRAAQCEDQDCYKPWKDFFDSRMLMATKLADSWEDAQSAHEKEISKSPTKTPFRPLLALSDIKKGHRDQRFLIDQDEVLQLCERLVPWWLDRLSNEINDPLQAFKNSILQRRLNASRFPGAELSRIEHVELSEDRTGQLIYELSRTAESPGEIFLRLDGPVSFAGQSDRHVSIAAVDREATLKVEVTELPSDRETCRVALLDENNFPLDIKETDIYSLLNVASIDIEFRVPASGKLAHRMRLQGRKYLLQMPPERSFTLQPVLMAPKVTKATKIQVESYYFDENQRLKELFLPVDIEVVAGQREYPIAFGFGDTGQEAPQMNLINGMKFVLSLSGGNSEKSEVIYHPHFTPPEQFLKDLGSITYEQTQNKIEFNALAQEISSDTTREYFLPDQIEVHLGHDGQAKLTQSKAQLNGVFSRVNAGDERELAFNLIPDTEQNFEVYLDVGPWPHVKRWKFENGKFTTQGFDPSRIETTTDGASEDINHHLLRISGLKSHDVIWRDSDKRRDPIQVNVELNSGILDRPESNEVAILEVGIRRKGATELQSTILQTFRPNHSYDRRVTIADVSDQGLKLRTDVSDYSVQLDLNDIEAGEQELFATVRWDETESTYSIDFIIDETPPEVDIQFVGRKNESARLVKTRSDEEVELLIKAFDISGVNDIMVWLDLDKSGTDQRLERITPESVPPDEKNGTATVKFVPKEYGFQPGIYSLMAKATNGAQKTGTGSATIEIVAPTMAAKGPNGGPPNANGSLVVEFASRVWRGTVDLRGDDEETKNFSRSQRKEGSATPTIEFKDLKPGKYKLVTRRLGDTENESITIAPGQESRIKIE